VRDYSVMLGFNQLDKDFTNKETVGIAIVIGIIAAVAKGLGLL
jgi:hypothetical protein